ncbi:protein translocase subunit SecF [Paenibacillus sp. GYB004]|uniref:protein translocase subunit SecF n=1 Tax=Paenibacillus sp. GYB004 TaxID=2994393 RepID=UPI002F969D3F
MNYKNRYDFVKNRNLFFGASLLVTIIGIVILLISGLHYGVDFKAGTSLDVALGKTTDRAQVEKVFGDAGLNPVILTMGGNNDRFSARYDEVLTEEQVKQVISAFTGTYGDQVSHEVNTVSPDMANEMKNKAILAVAVASIAVSLYVTIRFEWRFALSAIITILYDAFFVIAIFSIFRLEVDLPFVAAVLTTIGYSINDKIVILDRIRENLRFAKLRSEGDLAELVHTSIWQTMSRSINTVVTVIIAAVCLYLFGSESIKLFALAKLIGLVSGVYSSICLATPLWYLLKRATLRSGKVAPAKANS